MAPLNTSEHGVNVQHCENYHLYMVTLKPSFRSYIKKSINKNDFMLEIFEIFNRHFCTIFKFVDAGIEYDTKGVCHIHAVYVSKKDVLQFREDGFSLTQMINFKKGIYVDFRMFPYQDLDKIIEYINKGTKTDELMKYYRTCYGFI